MRRVREQVHLAVTGGGRVVIVGPPGSGREHVARTIHSGPAPDAAGLLLPLSCGTLDAELLRTTILAFLRRCAATAPALRPTLLLLDIDELSEESQAELLAFFRIPTFRARTLVTSRRSLLELADASLFSRELALALSTLVIELPGLAERRQDIPLLAQQLIEEFNARGGRQFQGLSPDALDAIAPLPWTGNVLELADVLHEACRTAAGPWITADDLPQRVRLVGMAVAHPPRETETIVLDEFLAEIERELIQRALRQARGNKAQAARLLGLPRARLLRKLTQFGLEGVFRG